MGSTFLILPMNSRTKQNSFSFNYKLKDPIREIEIILYVLRLYTNSPIHRRSNFCSIHVHDNHAMYVYMYVHTKGLSVATVLQY